MKRYLIPLFIAFSTLLCLQAAAQVTKPDWVRSPNGPNTVVDWNLKAKSLIIPHGPATTLGGSQDSVGHVYMVLNPGVDTSLYMYTGGGVWKPVSKGSSLNFTNGLTKTGSTVSLGGTASSVIDINIPGQSFIVGGTGYLAHPTLNINDGVQIQMGYDDNTTNFFESQYLLTSAFFGNSAYSGKIAGITVNASSITLNDEIGLHGLLYEGTYYSSSPKWLTPKRYVDSLVAAGIGTLGHTLTINNSGTGAASGSSFNGGSALTISYNTVGAQPAFASGTGFVKISGTTISYDNSTYLTGITGTQVTTALGFTPYNATNPSGYQTAVQVADTIVAHKATIGYGLLYTSGTNTISADSTNLQTINNFFPKGDTRYYKSSNPSSYISRTGLSATTPLSYNNSTGVFSIQVANTSQDGYLAHADWNTFNGKQAALSGTGYVKDAAGTISYITSIPNTDLANSSITINGTPTSLGGSISVGTLTTSNFVPRETPSGSINGSNTSFTLANTPVTGTVMLFWNGVLTTNFTNSGTNITTTFTPNTGDTLIVAYQK